MKVKDFMKRFLEEEAFKYEWEADGVTFKYQGLKIIGEFYDDRDTFLRLVVAYHAENLPRYVALDMCNELNQSSVLKHYLIDDDTLVVLFEEFFEESEVTNESVMDVLDVLVGGARRCNKRMDKLTSYLSHPVSKVVN